MITLPWWAYVLILLTFWSMGVMQGPPITDMIREWKYNRSRRKWKQTASSVVL